MTIEQYIQNINNRYKQGNATEHTFRGDLQQLLESLVPNIVATNEPKRQTCGAPDYILTKKDIPVGFIEAKDIGDNDLAGQKKTGNKEQFDRYKASLSNIIFTDYLDFHLYRDGQFITSIKLAEFPSIGGVRGGSFPSREGELEPLPQNFAAFTNLIKDFCTHISQTIKSSKRLAEMMAGKARLLANVIEKALNSDEATQENSTLKEQMNAFKEILIHDITPKAFADVYAQTIAYGMFAARLHDPTLPTFSRQEAAELIPKSNPFLRKLFGYIAGPDIDDRIKWIVDSLVEVFLACNVEELLKNYGKNTKTEDPIIHFYETFLSEYDASLRKARGVWYTPHPVVNFIVRAVDDILKTEFNLPQGLADTSKTKIKVNLQSTDKRYTNNIKTIEEEVHRVQILDPATGTGTFLAEVVKHIHKKFEGQQGIWSNYVEKHLLPRLNGFELLMASYAMAHLQLDILLKETGYSPSSGASFSSSEEVGGASFPSFGGARGGSQRLKIYLTNSLEESHPDTGTLFANWLSSEANEANQIKRDTPVMCIIGNPPYSGESANKGEWIMKLMEDYKKEPGGKEKLNERNPKWINDDYVKFLRYGQHFIEKNGSGVLAFINPHGFLDNPTFRGMRWNLLKTYDKIYTIDLHGNSKKKETAPDGSADQNVFDIMQGVSINIFIKTGKKKVNELGKIFHKDVFGKRELKYDFLFDNTLKTIDYKELPVTAPNYFFVNKDFDEQKKYEKGFVVSELFNTNSVGIVTARDNFTIHDSKENIEQTIQDFLSLDDEIARVKYDLGKDVRDWQVSFAKKDLQNNYPTKGSFVKIAYRPFDEKWTYYTGKSKGFHCYPRNEVMQHFVKSENLGLVIGRQGQVVGSMTWNLSFITNSITDFNLYYRGGGVLFPLYLYPETATQISTEEQATRVPNLNATIVDKIAKAIDGYFVWEKQATTPSPSKGGEFAPIDVLDYIYAVLHSPTYRKKYKEFLKIDFPRVPYPKNQTSFKTLCGLGKQLREIHLLESPIVENYITQYPINGDNVIDKIHFDNSPYSPPVEGLGVVNSTTSNKEPKSKNECHSDAGGISSNKEPKPSTSFIPQDDNATCNVFINSTQYFANVPQVAWEFYIGGYQPAQKWLKDRKGRALDFEDILHYQKIIAALTQTDRLMKEIDKIEIE